MVMVIPGRVAEEGSRVQPSAYRDRFRVEQRKRGATQSDWSPAAAFSGSTTVHYGLGTLCTASLNPPHTSACFFDDKSSITSFMVNLIGYPNPRTGAPHDSTDSECRGCSPLLQLNNPSHLPQFPDSI
ncbi:hypothetical protein N7516_003463 [Penicillium verrucosum]|uniref:uncharacterized protein n=1 Tax=Penicillium verrucosum TaxID=60171 RepID=UPI002545B5F8|nr:uncharacterized protein N7516_003463 [Penicillium verrucosum]KAJ5943295.1 hypothetical protein N7516_003463 [Penicillium verrucosum]